MADISLKHYAEMAGLGAFSLGGWIIFNILGGKRCGLCIKACLLEGYGE